MLGTDLVSLAASPGGLVQGARLLDGAVALKWVEASDATWIRLGGPRFAAPPAITADREGRLWVFARDAEGVVHANVRQDNIGWSGWQSLGGTITDGPSACLDAGGRVVVFGRGTDGAVWHKWLDGATWSAWTSLGGGVRHAPSAALTRAGRLTVFAVGTDNALWHRFHDGGWSDWISLEGQLTASPAAVVDGVGMLRVFGRGTDGALWTRHHDLQWRPWQSLGGGLASAPAAAADRSGRLRARGVGTDGATIHERAAITAWEEYAAVDRLPLDAPDPAAEEERVRRRREELKKHPAVQRAARILADGLRVMHARGVTEAREPGRIASLDEYERRVAERYGKRTPEQQERLSRLARDELARVAELREREPQIWGAMDPIGGAPLAEQLAVAIRRSGLGAEQPAAPQPVAPQPVAPKVAPKIRIKRLFRPQGGASMQFRIHEVYCAEETDEVGDDTITMAGFTRAPGGQPAAFGPHDLGDFSDTDGPEERARRFDVTDSRANFRWPNAPGGSFDDPYLVSLTLCEVDGDVDEDFMTGITRLVDLAAGVLAATGPWGAVAAAALELAWLGISTWWKEAMEDEVAPALVFEGWAGMANANTPRKTWMEWDGGRYELTYSWSPPDLFASFDLSNVPPVAPVREREFFLIDEGPFTHIGAAVTGGRYGLWARRPDGRVLFRDSPTSGWVEVAGAPAEWLDDGWALVDGQAAKFDSEARTYTRRMSRESGSSLAGILRFSRVAGSAGATAWAIADGKPYREAPVARPKRLFGVDMGAFDWRWDPVPSDAAFAEIVVAPGDPNGRVWALGTDGVPHEWRNGFTARPASFPVAALSVAEGTETFGISRGGQTYLWTGSAWDAFVCYERRSGTKVPLVVRQMRAMGRYGVYLTRHFLLTATGRLYEADGQRFG